MTAAVQLAGVALLMAGLVAVTGSAWPLVAGGLLLLAAPEMPGLRAGMARRRALAELQRRADEQTGQRRGPEVPR